jgi:LysM repeat protein
MFCAMKSIFTAALLLVTAFACDRGTDPPPEAVPLPNRLEGSGASGAGTDEGAAEAAATAEPEAAVVPDFQLHTTIRARFVADPSVPSLDISVSVIGGDVWLRGTAETGSVAARAEAIAAATEGIGAVHNEIIAPQPTDEERTLAEQVPEEVLAATPQFAPGPRNYATGQLVDSGLEQAQPAQPTQPTPPAEPAQTPQAAQRATGTYTVRAGDSLWDIARETMGSGARWEELYEANRDVIGDDPMNVRAGVDLTIPRP